MTKAFWWSVNFICRAMVLGLPIIAFFIGFWKTVGVFIFFIISCMILAPEYKKHKEKEAAAKQVKLDSCGGK